ncbi:hypothetical protein [Aliirhizobium smilacinae]|uniref:Uncharacterized protein n=1 Tax=Aliirhizobium smilacinae TaxID=1395944 RepID=A0A5C4XFU2_9HYPH|nr:hypothetical protein [Rhizobium smilacinae]TNM61344.1 hypothetical protein FHP24_22695 [Rhizobium smilacinae]
MEVLLVLNRKQGGCHARNVAFLATGKQMRNRMMTREVDALDESIIALFYGEKATVLSGVAWVFIRRLSGALL